MEFGFLHNGPHLAQVVNKMEVEAMGAVGVPFFAMSIAVGVSLALPGFKSDMTKGMLGALPQARSRCLSSGQMC